MSSPLPLLSAEQPGFCQRRILAPVVGQLTQGVTPGKLALAFAVGGVIAMNPFLGTTTLGCIAAGLCLRLNQTALQVANLLGAPLQLALIIPWVRSGEWIWGAAPIPINPTSVVAEFTADPAAFLRRFGLTGVHAFTAWLLAAPVLGLVIHAATIPLLRAAAARIRRSPATPFRAPPSLQ